MSVIQQKATEVAMNMAPENPDGPTKTFIDPGTIILIGQVIWGAIKLYRECRQTPEQAAVNMASPGWWTRRKLWRLVKEQVPADQDREAVYDEILRSGKFVTPDEVTQMYREVEAV